MNGIDDLRRTLETHADDVLDVTTSSISEIPARRRASASRRRSPAPPRRGSVSRWLETANPPSGRSGCARKGGISRRCVTPSCCR